MKTKLHRAILLTSCLVLFVPASQAQTRLVSYTFNQDTGTIATDSVGDLNLTLTTSNNTLKWSNLGEGLNNSGYSLYNASTTLYSGNKAVNTATGSTLDNLTSYTITGWFNAGTTQTSGSRLISTDSGMSLYFDDSQQRFYLAGTSGANVRTSASAFLSATGSWVFVAVTVDTTVGTPGSAWANAVKFYVGTEASSVTNIANASTSGSLTNLATGDVTTLAIGNDTNVTRSLIDTYLADFSIYSGALTSSEIEAVRQSSIPEPSASASLIAFAMAALMFTRRFRCRR